MRCVPAPGGDQLWPLRLLLSPSPGRALSSDFSQPPLAGCVVSVGEKPPTPTVPRLSVETGAVTPGRAERRGLPETEPGFGAPPWVPALPFYCGSGMLSDLSVPWLTEL